MLNVDTVSYSIEYLKVPFVDIVNGIIYKSNINLKFRSLVHACKHKQIASVKKRSTFLQALIL